MTRVSIVIPCHDDGRYLEEAVASAARQTHDDVEIIIVDDGSSDTHTRTVLARLATAGHRVLTQPNRGVSAARNAGIHAASGGYVLPLDADDRLAPDYAKHAADLLDSTPEVAIVGSQTQFIGSSSDHVAPRIPSPAHWLMRNQLPVSCTFRREAWAAVGGYREGLAWGEDWLLWVAIVAQGHSVAVLQEVGLYYRRRPGQVTERVPWALQEKTRELVLSTGTPIAVSDRDAFARLFAQRLNLLEVLRQRYRIPESLIVKMRSRR